MKYIELENKLSARIKKRRIVEAVLSILFLATAIVFGVLYEQSSVVEEIAWGPIKYESVTYNDNFLWGILVGVLGLIVSGIFLIGELLLSRLKTFEVGCDYITFYRDTLSVKLYVNGELKDGTSTTYHLEAPLSDGTKVNVALGKWSAHFTFTNGHSSIDV